MAQSGDLYRNPFGGRLLFHKTSHDTNGELLEVEVTYPPQSAKPQVHYHPHQEEHFTIHSGVIRVSLGGQEHSFTAGESFCIPAKTVHWMHNISDEPSRLTWQVRPALNTEQLFETLWGLAGDGKTNASGVPNLLQLAVTLPAHQQEIQFTNPPRWVQKLLFALLAPIARLFGYQAVYKRMLNPVSKRSS